MSNISVLAQNLKSSEIIKIAFEVNELKRNGEDIANLTIGDFDSNIYPIPDELKQGIIDAYKANLTNYPTADGVLSLRESISVFLKEKLNLTYGLNEILISGGSRPLIYATYLTIVDKGEKVIYPAPSWNNNHYCDMLGVEGIAVQTTAENNFMPRAADLEPFVKDAVLLALCSPLNPTGTMFSKQDLEEICDLVIKENKSRKEGQKPLYILYDQIYAQLTFGEHVHVDPVSLRPELKDYVIFIDGASKCFAATGVRVGWSFGPEFIIEKMKGIVGHMGAWAPKPEQVATSFFLKNLTSVDEYLAHFKDRIQKSLDTLYKGFNNLKAAGFAVDAIEPMGAIYLTVRINCIGKSTVEGELLNDSHKLNSYLIKEAKVALVPFSAFGTTEDEGWFRASVGASSFDDINEMIPRLKSALAKLV